MITCLDGSIYPEGPARALGASVGAGVWFSWHGTIHLTTGKREGSRACWTAPFSDYGGAAVTDHPFPHLDFGLTYLDGRPVF